MATTATRQQSAAIRDQMQLIRNRLPYSMDEARAEVRQLTDWKYHAAQHPGLTFGLVAAVAYWLVPRKRPEPPPHRLARLKDGTRVTLEEEPRKTVAKASLASMLISTLMTFLLKTGTGLLTQRITQALEARPKQPR